MPPKQSSGTGRGRPKATTKKGAKASEPESEPQSSNPFELSDDDNNRHGTSTREAQAVEEEEPDKSIPPELLTRLLHEFFAKDATRISRDANAAAGKYFDVFVREAIARAAVEKDGGFLEVEDLEKSRSVQWGVWWLSGPQPRLWSSNAHYRNTMSPTTPGIHLKLKEVRTEYHPIDAMAACTAAWCLPTVSAQIVHIGVGDRTAGLLPQIRELSPAIHRKYLTLT
ncbi:hypothetical protein FOBRF1_010499 [Fusarium oxysporum]